MIFSLKLLTWLMPICGLGWFHEYFRQVSVNAALIPIMLCCLFLVAHPVAPWRRGMIPWSVVAFVSFLMTMEISNVWNGLWLLHSGGSSPENPLMHSVARSPLPFMLGFTALFGFFAVSERGFGFAELRRILRTQMWIALAIGYIQIFTLYFPNEIYENAALMFEGSNTVNGLSYVRRTGRVNLLTLEASEAGRLLINLYFPLVLTDLSFSKLDGFRKSESSLLLLGLSIPVLLLTKSTNCIFATAFVTVVWLFHDITWQPRVLVVLGIGGILSVALYQASPESLPDVQHLLWEKPSSISDPSTQTRYAFFVAAWKATVEHPVLGIGIGKGIFVYEQYFPNWGLNWETRKAFETGDALAPKSLLMRLLSETGVAGLLCYLLSLYFIVSESWRARNDYVRMYVPLATVSHLFYAILGGGSLYILHSWFMVGALAGITTKYASLENWQIRAALFGERFGIVDIGEESNESESRILRACLQTRC